MKANWKRIGKGIVYASIGAASFGAIHYMFLANIDLGMPDIMGIPMTVVLPFLVGAVGFVAAESFKIGDTAKTIMRFGSASVIGFGIATYANWITPVAVAGARARARYTPPIHRAPIPIPARAGVSVTAKMI